MELAKIRFDDSRFSWTVLDKNNETVQTVRDWIIHLEETNQSPNTIEAYARHVTRLGSYLAAHGKSFEQIRVLDYDDFLQWLPSHIHNASVPTNLAELGMRKAKRLSPSLKNQVHLAVKSFYRYLTGRESFAAVTTTESTRYIGTISYRPFLDHINSRRSSRKRDRYLSGDVALVQKKVLDKRLSPEEVLMLIKGCHLLRDAFLVTLLYNTGLRIGEALGLRHTDIDLSEKVIWVVPRDDNENLARAKSRRSRAVPVMDYVIQMYEDYMTSEEYSEAFESGTSYVFCNVQRGRVGRALSKSYAENLKSYLIKRTKIAFTWHMFRHTHASEAIAQGHGLLQVADRLGHSSPQTTADFYRHLFSREIRKMHLTGHENLKERLEEFQKASHHLSDRGIKWI